MNYFVVTILMPAIRILLLAGFCCLAFPHTQAGADTITLVTGISFEAAVLEETDDSIKIATVADTVHEIPKSKIKKREATEFVLDALDDRVESLPENDVEAIIELAIWCQSQGLLKEAYEYFQLALEVNPEQKEAREALGYRHDGKVWTAGSLYYETLQRHMDIVQRSENTLIPVNTSWITAKEFDVMVAGGREYFGHWLTEDQIKQAQALDIVEVVKDKSKVETELSVDLMTLKTPLIHLQSSLPEADNRKLIRDLTASYRMYLSMMSLPPQHQLWSGPVSIYIFDQREEAFAYYTAYLEMDNPPEMTALMKDNPRTYWLAYPGMLMYKFPGAKTDTILGELLHMFAHQLLYHTGKEGPAPHWLNEGFAAWMEYVSHGKATGFCYTPKMEDQKQGVDLFKGTDWTSWVVKMVKKKQDRDLEELLESELNNIQLPDLAKLFGIVNEFIRISDGCFRRLVLAVKENDEQSVVFETQFQQTVSEFDNRWRMTMRKSNIMTLQDREKLKQELFALGMEWSKKCNREWFNKTMFPHIKFHQFPGPDDKTQMKFIDDFKAALHFDWTTVKFLFKEAQVTVTDGSVLRVHIQIYDETYFFVLKLAIRVKKENNNTWSVQSVDIVK